MAAAALVPMLPIPVCIAKPNPSPDTSSLVANSYILGPGDALGIEIFQVPELSSSVSIGPDGTIYLPRLRALYVEGLTVEELRFFLTEQYTAFVKDPQVYIRPLSYRSVRVYVGGEISRPGYYTLSNQASAGYSKPAQSALDDQYYLNANYQPKTENIKQAQLNNNLSLGDTSQPTRWPTLFDALQAAQGVTPFSDLTSVSVTRKQPQGSGGGKKRAQIDFLRLVTDGDENVNIRLFDGDVVNVSRTEKVLRDQIISASRSNLSPDFVEVFVSGRVQEPGPRNLPQGATLNQAIASAGGPKLLRGSVEFLRFNPDGTADRRRFSYKPSAETDEYKNPVLMTGDIVRINESLFSAGIEVLNEVTGPAVGIYSVYSLFKP